jgi:hypothetical protein
MKLKVLVDKLMGDKRFYELLEKNPEAALRELEPAAKPTAGQIKALTEINYKSLEEVAKAFGERMT